MRGAAVAGIIVMCDSAPMASRSNFHLPGQLAEQLVLLLSHPSCVHGLRITLVLYLYMGLGACSSIVRFRCLCLD